MSEHNITHVSAKGAREMETRTNWKGLRKKTDAEIEEAVAEDPDAALLEEEDFETARSRRLSGLGEVEATAEEVAA